MEQLYIIEKDGVEGVFSTFYVGQEVEGSRLRNAGHSLPVLLKEQKISVVKAQEEEPEPKAETEPKPSYLIKPVPEGAEFAEWAFENKTYVPGQEIQPTKALAKKLTDAGIIDLPAA